MWNRIFKPVWGAKEGGRRLWLWIFIFLTLELLLIRWLQELQRQRSETVSRRKTEIQIAKEPLPIPEEKAPLQIAKKPSPEPTREKAAIVKAKRASPKAVDFRRIDGIGPKVNQLLHEAGIRTYEQLADSSEEKLRAILGEANLYMINPESWPEQAREVAGREGKD
ncbi:MAG TPA: DUF4332 domain-containing protein [Anaerolineales bacterium]|jgi:predicted flap endonuclease-1-like 5' DNA nuclease|nr:DUF4332 domain-containing protein [Anaerolineales bacterium]